MTLRRLFFGIIVVLLLGVDPAYAKEAEKKTASDAVPPTVMVDSVKLVSEAAPMRYVGSVEAIKHVDIVPRVTGNLQKINFTEGAIVKAGDLLYELEDTTYRAAVDGLKAQKEQLEASLRYADREYKRNSTLVQSNAVAVSSFDKARMEIDSAKASLKQLEASLTDAENTLSYTRIFAPITGRIGKSAFTEGNLITPQGGTLTDIEMIAPIYVRFSLSERIFRRDFGGMEHIRDRAVVRIRLADNTVYHEAAKITLIDNKVNSSTNTITLWATFENCNHELIPGSFVTVLVSAKAEKQLPAVLPSSLILENDGYCVYVLGDRNQVEKRKVEIGSVSDGLQIVTDGLTGTERIVVDGTHKVEPDMTVNPVSPETGK